MGVRRRTSTTRHRRISRPTWNASCTKKFGQFSTCMRRCHQVSWRRSTARCTMWQRTPWTSGSKSCAPRIELPFPDADDFTRSGPFVFGCQDSNFLLDGEKLAFPEVPVPVIVPYIIDQVIARRYSGAWRFSPSSADGRPRPVHRAADPASPGASKDYCCGSLIGWVISLFLAYSFGAYVGTIS